MKPEEFVDYVNRSISPESGLRHITIEDLHLWHKIGFFVEHPKYYRTDFHTVLALLRNEACLRRQIRSQLAQPIQVPVTGSPKGASQRSFSQVICCVGSSLIEEQLIIRGLKETDLIASAGQVAVNFSPFSRKPVDIPDGGAQAMEGDLLLVEFEDQGDLEIGPLMTPLGQREFTTDDTVLRELWKVDSARKPELLSEIEQEIPPKTERIIQFPYPLGKSESLASTGSKSRKRFARSLFTFPIFVPIMTLKGVPATMIESTYVAPRRERIPRSRNVPLLPSRLYPAFLDTGGSMHEIVNFLTTYDISLYFRISSTGDPQKDFLAEQQKMRQLLVEARGRNLRSEDIERRSPPHEDALVEQDFMEALFSTPDYADYLSEYRRARKAGEQEPKFLPVRRFYSWLDYMWAEVMEDITGGLIPPLCKGCGKVMALSPEGKQGRRREYCVDCDPARGKERIRRHRSKLA
ncbi:MAG: hypothetical protein PHV74_02415 [Dehalococcoidia bacterium]|nr:hypothetical protein [Dehalococcoidia bacterium]